MAQKTERDEEESKMVRHQILLPADLWDPCVKLGRASDVSASAIVRYAIRDFLARKVKK